MSMNALTHVLWRTLGGAVGAAILVGFAFAMARFVGGGGVSLSP